MTRNKNLNLLVLLLLLPFAGCGGSRLKIATLKKGGVDNQGSGNHGLTCLVNRSTASVNVLVDLSGNLVPGYLPPPATINVQALRDDQPTAFRIVNILFDSTALRADAAVSAPNGDAIGSVIRPLRPGTHPIRFEIVDASDPSIDGNCDTDLSLTTTTSSELRAVITANGAEDSLPNPLAHRQSATISFASINASNCQVSLDGTPLNVTGRFGEFSTGELVHSANATRNFVYTVSCNGAAGGTITDTVTVPVNPSPTATLSAQGVETSLTVPEGGFVDLSWVSRFATNGCRLNDGVREFPVDPVSAVRVENIRASIFFTLTCRDKGIGVAQDTFRVNVAQATASLVIRGTTQRTATIRGGTRITLDWSSQFVYGNCIFSGGGINETVAPAWSAEVTPPNGSTVYSLSCRNANGGQVPVSSVTIIVLSPAVTLTVNGVGAANYTLPAGADANVEWNSADITTCSDPFGGTTKAGSRNVSRASLTANRTFTITCQSDLGPVSASVQVLVGRWYQADERECSSFCAGRGLQNVASPEGYKCTSGENIPASAIGIISYNEGCWPNCGPHSNANTRSVGESCYRDGQKHDDDDTDDTMGCFCV